MSGKIPGARDVLTPDALALLAAIAEAGSFAAAARATGMVPSALTYRVRRIEEALDVLLFDRSSRQARLTPAGAELLREGERLLEEIDAVALRVKRVATGWEPQFTVAVDGIINRGTLLSLCADFFALAPPTRLRLRQEVLSGTLEALTSGQADLALGIADAPVTMPGLQSKPLGSQRFVFAVAPHHPLAREPEPLGDDLVCRHRVVAVADSVQRGRAMTIGLLAGQEVFTVSDMATKLECQLRGLGVGTLPECLARPHIEAGRLVAKRRDRPDQVTHVSYAWRKTPAPSRGRALQWWLERLEHAETRAALLGGG